MPQNSAARRAIGWAGLLAGFLDITAAAVLFGLKGKSPVYLLQAIAGGLLGMSSFQGGLATAALGAFFHFLIAFTAAAVFYAASRKLTFLVKHPVPFGLLSRSDGLQFYEPSTCCRSRPIAPASRFGQ